MSIEEKPFQRATIDAATAAFSEKGTSRRFLVADEVGLGKTVVARGVVQRMSQNRSQPLRVFYVCSNLAIAAQNLKRLVSFMSEEDADQATANVDRPSLMPTQSPPSNERVHIYSLTPGTALPSRRGPGALGRMEERAFGVALVDLLIGRRIPGLGPAMRGRVMPERFYREVRRFSAAIRYGGMIERGFTPLFRHALRTELELRRGQWLPAQIRALIERGEGKKLVCAVRVALAVAALDQVRPDLVIFDEFQRFRDFLYDPDEEDSGAPRTIDAATLRVLRAIRGEAGTRTPLLLLSATPYIPYRGRGADGAYDDVSGDFFEVIKFLNGGGSEGREAADSARQLFAVVEEEFRKGHPLSERAERARDELTVRLTRVLSRTERPRSTSDIDAGSGGGTRNVPLLQRDVSVFRHLKESLRASDYGWAVALWQSVPLPMQTLGRRYTVWRRSARVRAARRISLTSEMRARFGTNGSWAHPGLRALLEALPVRRLALPWVAPSLPWWSLGGDWRDSGGRQLIDGKLLVFSRFRAAPTAISGLVSYKVEAWQQGRRSREGAPTYDRITQRQYLAAAPRRPSLLGLFHPSPLLARIDPTARGLGNIRTSRATIRSQLRKLLANQGIQVVPRTSGARRSPWQLLASVEQGAGLWAASRDAWNEVAASIGSRYGVDAGGRLSSVIQQWEENASSTVSKIGEREFEALSDLALEAPGIVLARALRRHWKEALEPDHLGLVAGLCWRGMRSYFDAPWFVAVPRGAERSYPARIRRAVLEGNLESVLDEHFWYLGIAAGMEWKEAVAELEDSFRLRTSSVVLHEGGPDSTTLRLRCHAAMALNEARAEYRAPRPSLRGNAQERSLRPDEVRRAFNSPFWPHILVTTSIGQEGLDFHPWCRALAHWDLCAGPVALEQREGRISRYAGLSVRRAIATGITLNDVHESAGDSPWSRLARRADAELADRAGLAPWWVAPGSTTQRITFAVPGSERPARLARLNKDRALYRLVLGMPNQVDLLDLIADREVWDAETVERACLDLSAWNGARD